MNAEFQMNNKNIGRSALANGESAKAISSDQHGSRKHHKAVNTCLNKILLCDLSRQQRRALLFAMNDAKGCYNRIAHSIASLFLQRFGIPASAIVSVFSTL